MPPTPPPSDSVTASARNCSKTSRRCAAGEDVADPSLAAQARRTGSCPLSLAEREVLAACEEGASTAEVAGRLYLSEGTVRNKVSEILGKLGARNRTEAVRIARENGWL